MIKQDLKYPKISDDASKLLQRIAYHLMINASYSSGIGLYHGKMGIVLFFAHYAKFTNETLYDDFAGELLNEIAEEIHADTPVNFEYGLSGIGWGIEYLIQNKFMGGNPNEILSDIDNRIMEINLRKMADTSINTGLEGIIYYISKRLSSSGNLSELPFDPFFLAEYEYVKEKHENCICSDREILAEIWEKVPEGENITEWKYGIENGCSGYGLKSILT